MKQYHFILKPYYANEIDVELDVRIQIVKQKNGDRLIYVDQIADFATGRTHRVSKLFSVLEAEHANIRLGWIFIKDALDRLIPW